MHQESHFEYRYLFSPARIGLPDQILHKKGFKENVQVRLFPPLLDKTLH